MDQWSMFVHLEMFTNQCSISDDGSVDMLKLNGELLMDQNQKGNVWQEFSLENAYFVSLLD